MVAAGTLKKGKVARQALELLSRAAEASPRERELLKAVPEMDMINALVSHDRPIGCLMHILNLLTQTRTTGLFHVTHGFFVVDTSIVSCP
jgi:hypothetical protein